MGFIILVCTLNLTWCLRRGLVYELAICSGFCFIVWAVFLNLSGLGCTAFSELVFGRGRFSCCLGGRLPPDIASGFHPVSLINHSRNEAGWKTSAAAAFVEPVFLAVLYAVNWLVVDEIQLWTIRQYLWNWHSLPTDRKPMSPSHGSGPVSGVLRWLCCITCGLLWSWAWIFLFSIYLKFKFHTTVFCCMQRRLSIIWAFRFAGCCWSLENFETVYSQRGCGQFASTVCWSASCCAQLAASFQL